MHIATKAVSISIALAVLGGCSTLQSLTPVAIKPTPRNPPAALVDFKPSMTVKTAWSVNVGSAGNALFNPALGGDSIYVAAADGTLARLDDPAVHEWLVVAPGVLPDRAGVVRRQP